MVKLMMWLLMWSGKRSVSRRLKSLKHHMGSYFLANAGLPHIVLKIWTAMTSDKKLVIEAAGQKNEDLLFLKELIEAGENKIDHR